MGHSAIKSLQYPTKNSSLAEEIVPSTPSFQHQTEIHVFYEHDFIHFVIFYSPIFDVILISQLYYLPLVDFYIQEFAQDPILYVSTELYCILCSLCVSC